VYVPTYNPSVVYGAWWYPYPPYYMYPPSYVYAPGLAFATGVVVGIDAPAWARAEPRVVRSPLSRLGTVLPIAALGLGGAGAWSRHSADAAYRDYLRSVDRGRMEDRFRRAHRLDGVSMACWIGAEACLAGAAWVWLRGDGRVPIVAAFDDEGAVRLGLRVGGETPPSPARQGER
jgi:hypothetical protein